MAHPAVSPTIIAPEDGLAIPGELVPGVVVKNRYRIVRTLGAGGMGSVYEAKDGPTRVALKLMSLALAGLPEARERFHKEIVATRAVSHPHVIKIFDHGELDEPVKRPFYTMEFLEGEALSKRLEHGPLPIVQARKLLGETLRALHAVHCDGPIHRDLKPENLWITKTASGEECMKILDFGVVKSARLHPKARSTQPGAILGTPDHMAPEQIRGLKEVDARTDIYAMGVVLYAVFTGGKHPFDFESIPDLMAKVVTEPPVPPSRRAPVDHELEMLILSCLEKDPAKRPHDAGELARRVDHILRRLSEGPAGADDARHAESIRPTVPAMSMPVQPGNQPAPSNSGPNANARRSAASLVGLGFGAAVLLAVGGYVALAWHAAAMAPVDPPPVLVERPKAPTDPLPPTIPSAQAIAAPTPGYLSVSVSDPLASVWLDGVLLVDRAGALPRSEVPAGTHRLRVEAKGKLAKEQDIIVAPGATQAVVIDLASAARAKAVPRLASAAASAGASPSPLQTAR
jgi:serine/threonine-protein kinase